MQNPEFGHWTEGDTNWSEKDTEFLEATTKKGNKGTPTSFKDIKALHESLHY